MLRKKSFLFTAAFIALFWLSVVNAYAFELNVINSKDWSDVFAGMLYFSLQGKSATFLNSESLSGFTAVVKDTSKLNIYESRDYPYITNLGDQLKAIGYKVNVVKKINDFDMDLKPKDINKYILVSSDNYRILPSVASFAINKGYWVFILNEVNVDDVIKSLKDADDVIAIGNFRRDILNKIKPYVNERINNNNVFLDSLELAKRFDSFDTVVISDGFALESEYFRTKNPVLISGSNKLLDEVFDFLIEHNVKAVIVVGNSLATVGEQIREKSHKKISVFIKFGQADARNTGKVYALTFFPLPAPEISLSLTNVIYDPSQKKLLVYFKNNGNVGIYELTTLSVKNKDKDLGSAAQKKPIFIGAREVLPVVFDVNLPLSKIDNNTKVVLYTSFGLSPLELDNYLTMPGKYVPPYITTIKVKTLGGIKSLSFNIMDVAYYPSLNRIGIDLMNNGTQTIYYSIRIKDIIVNGLKKTLVKEGSLEPTNTIERVYIPVKLDKIDLQDNKEFNVEIFYGPKEDMKIEKITKSFEFKTKSSGFLTGLFSFNGVGSISLIGIIGAIILIIIVVMIRKKSKLR